MYKMAEQKDVVWLSIVESAVYKAINKLGFSLLKPQQMMAISAFIDRRDVFVVLPTDFGKTLCLDIIDLHARYTTSTLVSTDDGTLAILTCAHGVIT